MRKDCGFTENNNRNDILKLMSQPSADLISSAIEPQMREIESDARERRQEDETYQNEMIRTLSAIESNTANLYVLVELINRNTEQQDELIAIVTEIFAIAKSKDKEAAESAYKKVVDRIKQTVNDSETLAKVVGYATAVYELAKPIIEKLDG
jgi:hypothetical protein